MDRAFSSRIEHPSASENAVAILAQVDAALLKLQLQHCCVGMSRALMPGWGEQRAGGGCNEGLRHSYFSYARPFRVGGVTCFHNMDPYIGSSRQSELDARALTKGGWPCTSCARACGVRPFRRREEEEVQAEGR